MPQRPPAGGSSRRCPSRARAAPCAPRPPPPIRRSIRPACASRPTDSSTARAPSSRSTSPSRTRRGWSCRRSPRRPLRAARRPWRRTAARSRAGSSTTRSSARRRVHMLSLMRDRHAVQRAGSAVPRASSARARSSARSAITVLNADSCGSSCLMRSSDRSTRRDRRRLAVLDRLVGAAARRSLGEGGSSDHSRHFEEARLRAPRPARCASSSARDSVGAGTSSRSTGRFSTCEVGATPVVSSARICST